MKQLIIVTILSAVTLSTVWWSFKSRNNVCKTFGDYYSLRDTNENCYYNPELELTVPEIVRRRGYPIETYEVVTQDGYILTVFRIPHGKDSETRSVGKPVFLQHGVNSNCGCFVNVGRKSLAFNLADAGYDVWLGNYRGTVYGLNHLNLNHATDSEFWDFSFHEYGAYDISALLSFVHKMTKEKMTYIGYSMGTSAMYIYSSMYPDIVREQVNLFINLAPCGFFGRQPYTAIKYMSVLWDVFAPVLKRITTTILPSAFAVSNDILKYICLPFPFQMKLCMMPHVLVLGSGYQHMDPETVPVTLIHNNDKCPIKVWIHITQLWKSGTFAQYDHGKEDNLKLYGTSSPLEYNLTNMDLPTYFIRANSDMVNTKKDVDELYSALPTNAKPIEIHVIEEEDFGHFELITAKDVVSLVHEKILQVLQTVS